jgi:hypothetical protein
MACSSFTASDDHPNKCANCGEYPSAHLDFSAPDEDDDD